MPLPSTKPNRRETSLSDTEFKRISKVLYDDAGIHMSDQKKALVYSRLSKRLLEIRCPSFSSYCDFLESDQGGEERALLLTWLTTNVTRFFREAHHFEDLKSNVLPGLIERAKRGERIRLWSAGCATGEEPYSLGVTLLSLMPDAHSYDVRILATDIDRSALSTARQGVYPARALGQDVPPEVRADHFSNNADGTVKVSDRLRSLITFKEMNFVKTWPVKGPFDVIFCRNVVIYFDDPTIEAVWKGFSNVMPVGGRLFVGHSERLVGTTRTLFESAGVTTYVKI